jgi:hypothetical protein
MIRHRKRNLSTIRDLVAQLELAFSPLACVLLAWELGYGLRFRRGKVELVGVAGRTVYGSVDALQQALLRKAYRLVGRGRSGQ